MGQPFSFFGSQMASSLPPTLKQHFAVCSVPVCVCVEWRFGRWRGCGSMGMGEANEQLQHRVTSLTWPSTS